MLKSFRAALLMGLLLIVTGAARAGEGEAALRAVKLQVDGNQARVTLENRGSGAASGVRCRITVGGQQVGLAEQTDLIREGARGDVLVQLNSELAPEPAETALTGSGNTYSFQFGGKSGELIIEELRGRLELESLEVPQKIFQGEQVEVMVKAVNRGDVPQGGVVVLLENGKEVGRQRLLRRMTPGTEDSVTFRWTPRGAGAVQLGVAFEPPPVGGPRPGETTVNVEASRMADLTIESVTPEGPPRADAGVRVAVRVVNAGELPVFSLPVALQVEGKTVARRTERGRFLPGSVTDVILSWIPSRGGSQTLVAVVDPEHTLKESSAGNNRSELKLEVAGKPAVNLQVSRIEPPAKLIAGQEGEFGVFVTNAGDIPAFSCTVTLKDAGVPVATLRSNSAVEPGSELRLGLRWTPSLPGPGSLTAEVESGGPGKESTTEDNRNEVKFDVVSPRSEVTR